MRRFASMDESKNDEGYPVYPDRSAYNGSSSYINGKPAAAGKPRPNTDSYFYNSSPTHHPTGNGNRTLPQPPRSLPMTPGSNPAPTRMSFIPSKPFNNFLLQPQDQSPLSTSAPATITSMTSGRSTFMGSSPTTPSTTTTTSLGPYRQPPQQQNQHQSQQQQQQQQQRQTNYTTRRNGSSSGPPDPVPKSKIVSPYIVAVDSSQESDNGFLSDSPTSPDHLSTSSDPHGSKFSRMPPPRYRPQPPPPPPLKRPGISCFRIGRTLLLTLLLNITPLKNIIFSSTETILSHFHKW